MGLSRKHFLRLRLLAIGGWLLAPAVANAVVAQSYLPNSTVPNSVCYLEFFNADQGMLKPLAACSGTIIRSNRFLTAAHCLDNFKSSDTNPNPTARIICGNQILGVSGYVADPDFVPATNSDQHVHDVAILGVTGNSGKHAIAPIALATSDSQVQSEANSGSCVLAGFGRDDDSSTSWGTLHVAQFEYLTPAYLASELGFKAIPEQQLYCGPTHAAPGDSGGPVLCSQPDGSYVQIAVTMLEGHPTAQPLKKFLYSVHESIAYDLDWIDQTADLPKLPNS